MGAPAITLEEPCFEDVIISGCSGRSSLARVGVSDAAVTFNEVDLSTVAYAYAGSHPDNESSYTNTYSLPPTPLSSQSGAFDISFHISCGCGGSAEDFESATASFASPSSGSFDFTGSSLVASGATGGGFSRDYDFTIDTKSNFDLTYASDNSTFAQFSCAYSGACQHFFIKDLASQTIVTDIDYGAHEMGLVDVQLAPGAYQFGIYSYGQDSVGGEDTASGREDDHFSFSISAAPEPSTWALMITGVGLVGGVLRQGRRKVEAIAKA